MENVCLGRGFASRQQRRLAGELAACAVAEARKNSQEMTNWHSEARLADEAANAYGRNAASGGGSCQQQCSVYIVKGINPIYLP